MANTRITQGVIKPNENYLVGILTAQSIDVNGVLTYEDVTSIDSIGIITARKGIVSLGVVTATAFHGDGSQLTGIDATALKDSSGNVKIQAQASGAVHTGFSTMQNLRVTGIATFGTSSTVINGGTDTINVGTALTLGHTQGVQFHTQNLHADGFEINNINASGIITAAQFSGDGSNLANLPAGLGTALSSTQSSPLNKIYYTNTVLPVESTITVDTPASASAAYTQYADISLADGADLIISDGDDLIPDVLGLRPDGTFGGGALGRMRVDKIVGKDANSAVNVEKGLVITGVTTSTNVSVASSVTATTYYGSGANLTGLSGVSVASQADNRIITCTGTNDALTGESSLTFDGTTIAHTGTSFKIDGTDTNASNSNCYIQFNAGKINLHADENNVVGGTASGIGFNADGTYVGKIQATGFMPGTDNTFDLGSATSQWANVYATTFYGDGSGLTGVSAGGASDISFDSGFGIDFSATGDGTGSSNRSEILDDYESGEWTGSINSGSANINNPWYVKIGKLVIGGGSITAISDTSSSNSIIVNGLPFSSSGGNSGSGAVSASKNDQFDKMVRCYVSGTTVRFIVSSLAGGSHDYLRHSSVVQSSGSITFGFNYQTS